MCDKQHRYSNTQDCFTTSDPDERVDTIYYRDAELTVLVCLCGAVAGVISDQPTVGQSLLIPNKDPL